MLFLILRSSLEGAPFRSHLPGRPSHHLLQLHLASGGKPSWAASSAAGPLQWRNKVTLSKAKKGPTPGRVTSKDQSKEVERATSKARYSPRAQAPSKSEDAFKIPSHEYIVHQETPEEAQARHEEGTLRGFFRWKKIKGTLRSFGFFFVLFGLVVFSSGKAASKESGSAADSPALALEGVSYEDEQEVVKSTYVKHMQSLRDQEFRGKFFAGAGDIIRFHGVQHASNSPCEDEMVYDKADVGGNQKWGFWAVFDGHAGGETSKLLKKTLITEVAKGMLSSEDANETDDSIKATFKRVDDQIIQRGLDALKSSDPDSTANKSIMKHAWHGSCALLAIFDPSSSKLRVAVTGDSRAVLGRFDAVEGKYTALAMSIDQNGHNPKEKARIDSDHPDEPNVINPRSGRILGLAISRAFGDSRWKWSEEDSLLANEKHGGPRLRGMGPPGTVKTPPYLTAEPEIEATTVAMGKEEPNADFLIMASDGFWDHISSEDAVTCVAEWYKAHSPTSPSSPNRAAQPAITESSDRRLWPAFGAPSPIQWPLKKEKPAWGDWHVKPEDFVFEEQNAATHLVQNAFGGRKRGLFCGAMAEKYPLSRWARDDISVYVVFFGKVGGRAMVDEPVLRMI